MLIDATELRRRIVDNHLTTYHPSDPEFRAVLAVLDTLDDQIKRAAPAATFTFAIKDDDDDPLATEATPEVERELSADHPTVRQELVETVSRVIEQRMIERGATKRVKDTPDNEGE